MRSGVAVTFPRLPGSWLSAATEQLPGLAREIEAEIRAEVPAYSDDPSGAVSANVRAAVNAALHSFVTGLAGRQADEHLEVFRRLGRLEAESGRSHDTLQTAYRVATHQVAEFLALIAQRIGSSSEQQAEVRHAALAFVDQLASISRMGHDDAQVAGAAVSQAVTRLLELFVQPGDIARSKVVARARHVDWSVPERLRALEFVPEAAFPTSVLRSLQGRSPVPLLVGLLPGRCLGFVAADPADDVEAGIACLTAELPAEATVVVGPAVPLLDAGRSARIAHRLAHRVAGSRSSGVLLADDLLLTLFGADAVDVMAVLAESTLRPLASLGVAKRVKAGRVLSAMLEYGGLPRDAPELTDISPSTLQYRRSAVEGLIGPALRDRDRRVEIMLALRWALPRWEAELTMHERRAQAKRIDGARRPLADPHTAKLALSE